MAKVTGLSGNEIYCLALKNYSPAELVIGNSVPSMGFLGSLGAGFKNMLGAKSLRSRGPFTRDARARFSA